MSKNDEKIWLWHRRLGHPSFYYIRILFPFLFHEYTFSDFVCETCVMTKAHHTTFCLSDNKSKFPFSLVHSDVWRPAPIPTLNGMRWFVTFVDDCIRMNWIYHLKHKSDVSTVFSIFLSNDDHPIWYSYKSFPF